MWFSTHRLSFISESLIRLMWMHFFAFLGHSWFLMGINKMSRWFELKILILNHPWKSEIRPLEQILGWNRYGTFFWCTLYFLHVNISQMKDISCVISVWRKGLKLLLQEMKSMRMRGGTHTHICVQEISTFTSVWLCHCDYKI